MKLTFVQFRTSLLLVVGVGLIVYNSIWGDHNMPTFIVGLMFCGFPFVINLDQVLKGAGKAPAPAPETVSEEVAP